MAFLLMGIMCLVLLIRFIFWRSAHISTSAGAIPMAFGIMISGAFQQVSFLRNQVGSYATVSLLALLLWILSGFIRDLVSGKLLIRHMDHPIGSFAIGTWVAGISVSAISIVLELPMLQFLSFIFYFLAVVLFFLYLGTIGRNYYIIWRAGTPDYFAQADGVLLLACVADQSIVVAGNLIFRDDFPAYLASIGIWLGIFLYLIGLSHILYRYLWHNPGDLKESWKNTNCIIHGAMSITGLSCAVSHVMNSNLTGFIWLWVFATFVIVEVVELVRAWQRVAAYGWIKGLFAYSISQWSRNFTFGMFLAFTIHFPLSYSFIGKTPFFESVRTGILLIGKYAVLALFGIETALFLVHVCRTQLSSGQKLSNWQSESYFPR